MNSIKENRIIIGLVQINEKFEGLARKEHQSNYNNRGGKEIAILPYSIGLLQAYVLKHSKTPAKYEFLLPIYKRVKVQEAIIDLQHSNIVGFSCYVWNVQLSLAIAKSLKELNNDIIIVFGGPQIPNNPKDFLEKNKFIDILVHGEGEDVFLSILENYENRNWENISSISFISEDGHLVSKPKKARNKILDDYPSPYLEGVFEALINNNPNTFWVMLWETNRGCPFSCSFCDWGSAVNAKVYKFDIDRLFKELQWFALIKGDMIFCCDANYGMLERDYELTKFASIMKKMYGYPRILSVQSTKNATERSYKIQKLLVEAELNPKVTLSLQTVNNKTLESIKRNNISTEHFRELQRRCNRDKIPTYTDIILGLPDETYDSFLDGISAIIEDGQHNTIMFYNLTILPNAEMGSKEYQNSYGLIYVEQRIIKMHDPFPIDEEHPETITTVVATNTMPFQDWILSKAFSWLIELLNFNYAIKIPLVILNHKFHISFKELVEPFLYIDPIRFPVTFELVTFLKEKARDIQAGGAEFVGSREFLGVYWSAEQFAFIQVVINGKFDDFYKETFDICINTLESKGYKFDFDLIKEVFILNKTLICLPFKENNLTLSLNHNLWEYFQGVINCGEVLLEKSINKYTILVHNNRHETIESWLDHMILCKNVKEKALYEIKLDRIKSQ